MAELSGQLDRERDVDLKGRAWHPWARRVLLCVILVFAVAALLNAFGQEPTTSSASAPAATLSVEAPKTVRGGLIFEGRFEITATQALEHPTLVLASGWLDGITLNTLEPAPESETSRKGELHLRFAALPAGEKLTVWTQWQVNPVNVGTQSQNVQLYDGTDPLTMVQRDVTVLP